VGKFWGKFGGRFADKLAGRLAGAWAGKEAVARAGEGESNGFGSGKSIALGDNSESEMRNIIQTRSSRYRGSTAVQCQTRQKR